MQQATVNLLADMRAQPSTLVSGLVAATASTDTAAPTSTITEPDRRRLRRGRHRRDDPRHCDRHRRRSRRRGRGLDRRGHDLAPRNRHHQLDLPVDGHGSPSTVIRTARRRRQRPTSRARRGQHRERLVPVLDLGSPSDRPTNPDSQRRPATELGVRFTCDAAGTIRASASTRRRPTPARTPATSGPRAVSSSAPRRSPARRHGLAAGRLPDPDRDRRQHQLRRRLFRARRVTTPKRRGISTVRLRSPTPRADRQRATARAAQHDGLPNGLYKYSSTPHVPTNTFNAENYWVDVVYSGGHRARARHAGQRRRHPGNTLANVSWSAPTSGAHRLYTVTPYVGTVAQTAKTVTGSPPPTSTVVSGLANGTTYTFRVVAKNGSGSGRAVGPLQCGHPGQPHRAHADHRGEDGLGQRPGHGLCARVQHDRGRRPDRCVRERRRTAARCGQP